MWAVVNHTPFAVDRTFTRDVDGAHVWIVAVRATYDLLEGGEVGLAEEQQPVCTAPLYSGEPGRSSLLHDTDLVRTKPGTDVLLHGSAHAPDGEPVTELDVAISVGPLTKGLRVVGDRTWERGLTGLSPGKPRPFVRMPLVYERSWGGADAAAGRRDPWNPVGVGAFAEAGGPVPNIELPDAPIRSHRHSGRPADHGGRRAGFGPVGRDWQPRASLAGTFDDAWSRDRRPLLPLDFDDRHHRSAPEDQQVQGFLRGGEDVALLHLSPQRLLTFRLPRVHLGFTTEIDGGVVHHGGRLHTVILEPDERRLVLVWQTSLACHHTMYSLKKTIVREKRLLSRLSPESPRAGGAEIPPGAAPHGLRGGGSS